MVFTLQYQMIDRSNVNVVQVCCFSILKLIAANLIDSQRKKHICEVMERNFYGNQKELSE